MDLIFIGDRPAQLCALVLDEPTRYTGDKLDPFMVHRCVESYVTDSCDPSHTTYRRTQRHIVLSTGLTWAPKYDGMVVKQLNTLLRYSPVTPVIFVMPVSSRILLGHSINAKLAALCVSSPLRLTHTWFLGRATGFAGDAAYPTQPTPAEVLDLIEAVRTLADL